MSPILSKDILAIIPARSGSKGVPDKNIKLLMGHPLFAYSIAAAKLSGIRTVIVSTDSEEYSEIAKSYGAEVPFIRPSKISKDSSTDFQFMLHAMKWFKSNKRAIPEQWIHLRPTTPLRDPEVINDAVNMIIKNPEATSLRSGHELPESPFKWFLKDENGYFKGLREDLTAEKVNMPRQLFPKMYNPNGYIDIVRSSYVLNNKTLHGDKMIVFDSPFCVEIDTKEDFDFIEYEIEKKSSPLLKWLNKKIS